MLDTDISTINTDIIAISICIMSNNKLNIIDSEPDIEQTN